MAVTTSSGVDGRGRVRRDPAAAYTRELAERRRQYKFAECCAGVVPAGETSLSSAILNGDGVTSHGQYGRNRP